MITYAPRFRETGATGRAHRFEPRHVCFGHRRDTGTRPVLSVGGSSDGEQILLAVPLGAPDDGARVVVPIAVRSSAIEGSANVPPD